MLWLSAVLVAVVSNLDNLAAGFAFGMRDTRIGVIANVLIAAVTMVATAVAMTFGRALAGLVSPSLASDAGSLIIIAIGVATVVMTLDRSRRSVARPVAERSLDGSAGEGFSRGEAVALGVALSLNNVGAGVGAGIAGVSPLSTAVLAGAISLVCLAGGSRAGWSVARLVAGRPAPLVAGFVLVGVGAAMLSGAG